MTATDATLRDAGIAVTSGAFIPGGGAVRLDVAGTSRWLEPDEAHHLAVVLEAAALDALHADRESRRGTRP